MDVVRVSPIHPKILLTASECFAHSSKNSIDCLRVLWSNGIFMELRSIKQHIFKLSDVWSTRQSDIYLPYFSKSWLLTEGGIRRSRRKTSQHFQERKKVYNIVIWRNAGSDECPRKFKISFSDSKPRSPIRLNEIHDSRCHHCTAIRAATGALV